ncbi:MAG: ABC transporter permease [Alloprevotella sp.]|nr:ABC transporter permease [Alloprevotella sp.]
MNKIIIIIRREFMMRIKKKSFIILTILMPFIFAALIFVPLWLSSIKSGDQKTVAVVDATGRYADCLKDSESWRFCVEKADKPDFYKDDSGYEAVVIIAADPVKNPSAAAICAPKPVSGELLTYVNTMIGDRVKREKLEAYNVPQLENIIRDVETSFSVQQVLRTADGTNAASDTNVTMAAGFVLTFLIYLFVMTYGGMIMQSVIEEKTNRIVELMVSSVKPFQLMMGKIIGVALVGLFQMLVWAVMLVSIFFVCSEAFGGSPEVATPAMMSNGATAAMTAGSESDVILSALYHLPFGQIAVMFFCCFVGGYLLYASFFAAVGASINSQEDSSQFIMPVVLIMVFSLYAAMYSIEDTNSPLAFWASMFPLTSPIVMMVRIPFGVPLWQELLSAVLLLGTSLLFIWLSGKIYRVGILMYGKKPSIREMLKWVRYK